MDEDIQRDLQEALLTQTALMPEPPRPLKQRLDVLRAVLGSLPPSPSPGAALAVRARGEAPRLVPLTGVCVTVGKAADNTVIVDGDFVSRHHCLLRPLDGDWLLEDRGSTNGVYINGEPVRRHFMVDGDIVQLGTVTLFYLAAPTTAVEAGFCAGAKLTGEPAH